MAWVLFEFVGGASWCLALESAAGCWGLLASAYLYSKAFLCSQRLAGPGSVGYLAESSSIDQHMVSLPKHMACPYEAKSIVGQAR